MHWSEKNTTGDRASEANGGHIGVACEQALSLRKWEPATIMGVIWSLAASRSREFLYVGGDCNTMQNSNKFKASSGFEEIRKFDVELN